MAANGNLLQGEVFDNPQERPGDFETRLRDFLQALRDEAAGDAGETARAGAGALGPLAKLAGTADHEISKQPARGARS